MFPTSRAALRRNSNPGRRSSTPPSPAPVDHHRATIMEGGAETSSSPSTATTSGDNDSHSANSLLANEEAEQQGGTSSSPTNSPRATGAPFVFIQEEDMMMNALFTTQGRTGGVTLAPRGGNRENAAAWQEERERRQRTVRVLLLFLLLLLLMDNDEQHQAAVRHSTHHQGLRGKNSSPHALNHPSNKSGSRTSQSTAPSVLSADVFSARRLQDARLQQWSRQQKRYQSLQQKNVQLEQQQELEQQVLDSDPQTNTASSNKIWHYPWNSTGFYRGEWTRTTTLHSSTSASKEDSPQPPRLPQWQSSSKEAPEQTSNRIVSALELEGMLQQLPTADLTGSGGGPIGVVLLPVGLEVEMRNDHNLTSTGYDQQQVDTRGKVYSPPSVVPPSSSVKASMTTRHWWETSTSNAADSAKSSAQEGIETKPQVTLTRDRGRLALQLYSRTVPAMSELSLVEGFVKLYDSGGGSAANSNPASYPATATSPSSSTRRDMLFRVRGVLLHSVGQLSLVSSSNGTTRSALVMHTKRKTTTTTSSSIGRSLHDDLIVEPESFEDDDHVDGLDQEDASQQRRRRRRLEEALSQVADDHDVGLIRDEALALYTEDEYGLLNADNSKRDSWSLMLSFTSQGLGNAQRSEHPAGEGEEDLFQLFQESLAEEQQQQRQQQQDEPFVGQTQRAQQRRTDEGEFFASAETVADDQPMLHVERKTQELWQTRASLGGADDGIGSTSPRRAALKNEAFPSSIMDQDQKKMFGSFTDPQRDQESDGTGRDGSSSKMSSPTTSNDPSADHLEGLPPWSDIVLPFPFVRDDADESIRRLKTPASRRMPPREQLLEANAAACEFEINFNVGEVEWTAQALQNLLTRRDKLAQQLNPHRPQSETPQDEKPETVSSLRSNAARRRKGPGEQQALVMNMAGSIHSPNCGFTATLNATALRTDWDATTSKAINYSFYMMLVCLTQIMILLRQLLHSQAQSAATRVSLLCIGWQTVIDALICLAHIYLSLAIQPLFTAFASVAFFKLLIFCVIEMKYMAIIIQARNSSNNNGGGQTAEELRRQVALLHIRFYVALFAAFLLLFYFGDEYRVLYVLALYSFWLPQIVNNIITEAKTPLHPYYIYGMTLTRLVAPLYLFAMKKNFLKEVYPDSPTDPSLCVLLAAWVFLQAAVLIAQGKYGARFMIPARFLPPKFDYSRPLPASMLPPGVTQDAPIKEIMMDDDDDEERKSSSKSTKAKERKRLLSSRRDDPSPAPSSRGRHTTARNRLKGKSSRNRRGGGANRAEKMTMTTETVDDHPSTGTSTSEAPNTASSVVPGLECSICYENIDVRHRSGYMLAPCDHLFHRDCLVQWMDVKMECPICRTELPAL